MNVRQCSFTNSLLLSSLLLVVYFFAAANISSDTSLNDDYQVQVHESNTSSSKSNQRRTFPSIARDQIRRIQSESLKPTTRPTRRQSLKPTKKATPFQAGKLRVFIRKLGIKLSKGMSVRVIARANQKVKLANDRVSSIPFHSMPDGAAVFPLKNGSGYVYVSNSEMKNGQGGVYGVYFDHNGEVTDYKQLLSNTTRNCSGGKTPWSTWISCEEYNKGQCWQVDPDPDGAHHNAPEMTVLGEDGGSFESVACDNTNPSRPVFYLTEDAESGALRRYRSQGGAGWDTLHNAGGSFDYLEFIDGEQFRWTVDMDAARESQKMYFRNVEGIDYFDGKLYFVSKKTYLLYILDLETLTYKTTSTKQDLFGNGDFTNTPDQIIRGNGGNVLYFTEDGGNSIGVYAVDKNKKRYAIFEAYSPLYDGDETTGLAFSTDGKRMYACFQDCGCDNSDGVDFTCGCLLEFSRRDGKVFDGTTLSLKFHGA